MNAQNLVHASSTLFAVVLFLQAGDPSASNTISVLDELTIQGGETHTCKA